MNRDLLYQRYQKLQAYVNWTEADAERVRALAPLVEPYLAPIIDDFYSAIARHPETRKVITGGQAQIDRLKGTLLDWIRNLFAGRYEGEYVERRWRVGCRHVEIGLDQVFTNVALARIRAGLLEALGKHWAGDLGTFDLTVRSLNTLLDLDLAIIEDAYQAEYLAREQRIERLATIGQVAGGVAHELRNPLNVVKTSVYYLLNARNPTPEKKAEHLKRIERHVELADGVITALSNFVRMPVPNTRPFSIEEGIRETLETNPPPAKVDVKIDIPAELRSAAGDPDQFRIVLGNLVRNACDAMPEGGRLTITGRACDHFLEVAVTDTGIGIPREDLVRISEPLYTTKAKGLGLGLAIARSILDKNRGELRVVSEPGKGSTFTVKLPATLDEGDGEGEWPP